MKRLKSLIGLCYLIVFFFLIGYLVPTNSYAGRWKEVKQTIMGKEYRVENGVKDGKEGCWVYWGEDKVWWEPKPWHSKRLKEEGLAYYDIWTQPGLGFPWNDSMEVREKYTADDVSMRGLNGVNIALGCPDYCATFLSSLRSPKGTLRVKKGMEWARSEIYYSYNRQWPKEEGKLIRKYAYAMTYPEDVKGMGGVDLMYSGKKDDETWFYLPSVRKVRRMSVGSRQDFYPGALVRNEDVFLTKPIHKYKIIRTELHKDRSSETFNYGEGLPFYEEFCEKLGFMEGVGVPCWVVEVTLPEDWYCAKQVRWYDMKITQQMFEYSYDTNGRLIRTAGQQAGEIPDKKEPWYTSWQGNPITDHNTGYTQMFYWTYMGMNIGVPEATFDESFLLKEVTTSFWWK